MKEVINILTDIGVSSELTTEQKGMLKLSNRVAWAAMLFIATFGIVGYFISEYNTVAYNGAIVIALFIPIVLNRAKKYTSAKLMLILIAALSIMAGSILYGYDSVFKYLMILPIAITFIFFSDESKWKLYVPVSLIILTLVVFEFDKFYNHRFEPNDFNHFFSEGQYTGHIYESLTFGLLIIIYVLVQVYYRSILKKKENELIIYKKIFDYSQEGVAIVNANLKYVKQNAAHEKMLGVTGKELSGKTPAILLGNEGLDKVKSVLEKERVYSGEILYNAKTGVKHIDLMAFSIMENKQPLCHVGIIRDITKKKKLKIALETSEKKYRTLVNLMGEGLGVVDENERFIFVNPQIEKIFGVEQGTLINRAVHEFLDTEQSNIVQAQSKLRKSGVINSYKLIIKTKGEQLKNIQITAAPYITEDEVTGTIAVIVDITKKENNLKALTDSEANLKKVNATKDKLFSIIAHDLRSPFNGILGFSELLIENFGTYEIAQNEKYLGIINSSAKKTLTLLDNLLNWAKSQSGQIEFAPEKLNVSPIIRKILDTSNSTAKIKNIALNYSQSDDVEVYADHNMLELVLRNLISNAIKFTGSGGCVNVLVSSKLNEVEITISDDGVGMKEETLKNLFEIATNTTSLGTANEKGSGLGLVLCHEFVKKHGGEIGVASEENKGSDFKFTLPIKK